MKERPFDLEDRLIAFAVEVIRLAESLPRSPVGNHIRGQLIRSGTSAAPNYGEAQSAESPNDFIHKLKVVLKELRETRVWLLIIRRTALIRSSPALDPLIAESNELIAIFMASIRTTAKGKQGLHDS
ncbi:MAG: four helix bundle protein [bacterium]